jgi:mitochondrial fission protein ELM1
LSKDKPGPSVWCVADGRAGILNQTLALAAALAEPERAAELAHTRCLLTSVRWWRRPGPMFGSPRVAAPSPTRG